MDNLTRMSGPEFLDAVADAEAANDNLINADTYRTRALEWARVERQLRELQEERDRLREQLAAVARAAQVAA